MYFEKCLFFSTFVVFNTYFMHSKSCSNCGAENDPLFTNCKYCKTALPVIDLNSISNEDLIQNAAEWVGKMGTSFSITGKDFNQWTMRDYRRFEANEIEGYAYRYLELLRVRATTNIDIQYSYERLQVQFNSKKDNLMVKLGGGDKRRAPLLFFFILMFGGITWGVVHLATSKDDNEIEIARLNDLEQQIITDLKEKKYDDASVLLNGLEYSINWSGDRDSIPKNSWRNKKNGYIETIKNLKANHNGSN